MIPQANLMEDKAMPFVSMGEWKADQKGKGLDLPAHHPTRSTSRPKPSDTSFGNRGQMRIAYMDNESQRHRAQSMRHSAQCLWTETEPSRMLSQKRGLPEMISKERGW